MSQKLPDFTRVPDGENFRLEDSHSLHITYGTTSCMMGIMRRVKRKIQARLAWESVLIKRCTSCHRKYTLDRTLTGLIFPTCIHP